MVTVWDSITVRPYIVWASLLAERLHSAMLDGKKGAPVDSLVPAFRRGRNYGIRTQKLSSKKRMGDTAGWMKSFWLLTFRLVDL